MLVRARFEGDIEALLPGAEVSVTPERDYRYRTLMPVETVMDALSNVITDIDYPNFKDAVLDVHRHPAYGNVWATMYNAGNQNHSPNWLLPDDTLVGDLTSRRAPKKRRKNKR